MKKTRIFLALASRHKPAPRKVSQRRGPTNYLRCHTQKNQAKKPRQPHLIVYLTRINTICHIAQARHRLDLAHAARPLPSGLFARHTLLNFPGFSRNLFVRAWITLRPASAEIEYKNAMTMVRVQATIVLLFIAYWFPAKSSIGKEFRHCWYMNGNLLWMEARVATTYCCKHLFLWQIKFATENLLP